MYCIIFFFQRPIVPIVYIQKVLLKGFQPPNVFKGSVIKPSRPLIQPLPNHANQADKPRKNLGRLWLAYTEL